MRCPYCGNAETKVTDKRDSEDGATRRRRECLKCKKRFTSYERPDVEIIIVKKDNRRENYDRNKLLSGIKKACEKRPISMERIEMLVDEIEDKLRKKGKEVESKLIGEMVMNALKKIDKVAYIRFASVYKQFQDLADFRNVMKEID